MQMLTIHLERKSKLLLYFCLNVITPCQYLLLDKIYLQLQRMKSDAMMRAHVVSKICVFVILLVGLNMYQRLAIHRLEVTRTDLRNRIAKEVVFQKPHFFCLLPPSFSYSYR